MTNEEYEKRISMLEDELNGANADLKSFIEDLEEERQKVKDLTSVLEEIQHITKYHV